MSESPQSEVSVTLGASGTLAFLVFGGRAGGSTSGTTGPASAVLCWLGLDGSRATFPSASSFTSFWRIPLGVVVGFVGKWLALLLLALESWELKLVLWRRGEAEDGGGVGVWGAAAWERGWGRGLSASTSSSEEESRSSACLWRVEGTLTDGTAWYAP